jgi:hypothetical protein
MNQEGMQLKHKPKNTNGMKIEIMMIQPTQFPINFHEGTNNAFYEILVKKRIWRVESVICLKVPYYVMTLISNTAIRKIFKLRMIIAFNPCFKGSFFWEI